jgi:amino acid adenylation domain-containing protein
MSSLEVSANITTSIKPRLPVDSVAEPHSYQGSQSVQELVATQAAATPDAIALRAGSQQITYRELDRRANQLANYLASFGIGREIIVALCLERSPESVNCALAVLKAGGAYLPLDPSYPLERLLFMLNDARPRVLITRTELAEKLSTGPWTVLNIDEEAAIEDYPTDASPSQINPEQLAYVIYTSGSTGRPKGIEITHASLLNLVRWHQRAFDVTSSDRASHLASVGFDAAVWEVWPYITAGASLHLPGETIRVSPDQLRDWLLENQITISFLPTALAERVMTLRWPATTWLRYLLTGAEALHRYPTNDLPFKVINNYGPTECSVVATSGIVRAGAATNGLPTIGRAIANTTVHILDDNLQPVRHGQAGELFIGGVGVARGYLNQPDLTAEKFIPDPFSEDAGARLYRTGDRARQLKDGEIAYLGRIDDQIKILGHRIEPLEIEAALDRHPAIASSAVIACGIECDEKRLAAYLVMSNGITPAAADLGEFLRSELPDYMIPSVFVKLPALPLTANGKVDRTALPEPSAENMLRGQEFMAPRTPIEERLAKMFCSLLNLSEVSVNDNFFLLGGHSLLGTQLIVKIRSVFGVDLALRKLFDAPTIAELSAEIERQIVAKVESMTEEEVLRLVG